MPNDKPDVQELARRAREAVEALLGGPIAGEAMAGFIDRAIASIFGPAWERMREERDIAVKSSNNLFTSRKAVLADLNAAESQVAALRAEVEKVKKERDYYSEKLGDWATARYFDDLFGSHQPGDRSYAALEAEAASIARERDALKAALVEIAKSPCIAALRCPSCRARAALKGAGHAL